MMRTESLKINKHLFSAYLKELSILVDNLKIGQMLQLDNKDLHQRLTKILRLKADEEIILFDQRVNTRISLDSKTFAQKKNVFGKILKVNKNIELSPEIIFCPAILKKSSFLDIAYISAQMGVNKIVPIITQKVQRKWGGKKEEEKLQKVMVAGCEQSKNFVIPQFQEPVLFKDFFKNIEKESEKVVFEVGGKPLVGLLNKLNEKVCKKIYLFFGPEGGFKKEEIELLKLNNFEIYRLTPTVLRSIEAVAVGIGVTRSLF